MAGRRAHGNADSYANGYAGAVTAKEIGCLGTRIEQ